MDFEAPGFHYNQINSPTVEVLEWRLTAREGGVAAMAVSSGAAVVKHVGAQPARCRRQPDLGAAMYGATETYFTHVLPRLGLEVRFPPDDTPRRSQR